MPQAETSRIVQNLFQGRPGKASHGHGFQYTLVVKVKFCGVLFQGIEPLFGLIHLQQPQGARA
jgi:hypothetical protein